MLQPPINRNFVTDLSIITVNYNNRIGLQKTFESVLDQTYNNFEFIVIDGGSSDGSKEVIESNQKKIAYWVSEKDRGIYHAMNKGIEKAKGRYLLFLNSGDYLCDASVLSTAFAKELTQDIVYGDIIWDTDGVKTENKFPSTVTFEYFTQLSLPHQASFIRKSLFESIGLYDENHRIISDWIFFVLAICKYNCSYQHIDLFISVCGRDGLSCEPGNWEIIVADRKKELQKYFPAFIPDYEAMYLLRDQLQKMGSAWAVRLQRKLAKLAKHK